MLMWIAIIYVLLPIAAFLFYWILINKMKSANISSLPYISLCLAFVHIIAWIILILNWSYSKNPSFSDKLFFYLVFISPFSMLIVSYFKYKSRRLSIYHKLTFILSLICFVVPAALFILLCTVRQC